MHRKRNVMLIYFSVAIHERMDLQALALRFPGRVLVTRMDAGKSVYDTDLDGAVALIFGNEGAGVTDALSKCAHAAVAIPMPGAAQSLNVAAAVAVCLFERVRQLARG